MHCKITFFNTFRFGCQEIWSQTPYFSKGLTNWRVKSRGKHIFLQKAALEIGKFLTTKPP